MEDMNNISESQKYTGTVTWLDSHSIGYILPDAPNLRDLYRTPLSLSSTMKTGDRVEFNVKFNGSNSNCQNSLEIVNVTPFGVKCNHCKKFGHLSRKCPKKKCFRCGLSGHLSNQCYQKFNGWCFNGDVKDNRRGSSYGNGENGGVCVISVKKKEDVKKVEEVEDCFILEFDPSVDDDDDDDSGSIVCVKKEDVKKVEKFEDCFILEFDPTDELDKFSNLSISEKKSDVVDDDDDDDDDDDVIIVAERGKVACRDYPHPRHLCATHPFKKAPKDIHCKMCYCYICDIPAPCRKWKVSSMDSWLSHCYATDESPFWRNRKDLEKTKGQMAW